MDQTSETEKVYQRQKYEEIIEILLTAGYFRARITDLSEFDKVVGRELGNPILLHLLGSDEAEYSLDTSFFEGLYK